MRSRRRSYRRNPSIMGFSLPPLQSVIYAGIGFAGVPAAEAMLGRFVPVSLTSTTLGKYAVRIGTVIGLAYVAKMLMGKEKAKMIGIGGGAYVLLSAVREFAPGMIPGLSAYTRPALGAYTPARRSLGAPAWGAVNSGVAAAPMGGANIVAARFRRFQ